MKGLIELSEDGYMIPYKIKGSQYGWSFIDEEDLIWATGSSWCKYGDRSHYLVATRDKERTILHRAIAVRMGILSGLRDPALIDHVNRNTLDNRRSNLRIATKKENAYNSELNSNNTSGYRGISWDNTRAKWLVGISIEGRRVNIGRFSKLEDAVLAYNMKALLTYGGFAVLNELKEGTDVSRKK